MANLFFKFKTSKISVPLLCSDCLARPTEEVGEKKHGEAKVLEAKRFFGANSRERFRGFRTPTAIRAANARQEILPRKSERKVARLFRFVCLHCRVARWLVYKPNIPIWVNFGGPWNGKCCYIL
jgi:hypothetical protein